MPATACALALKVKVLVPEPGAARLAGAKLAVTPAGSPVAERATALLKPPETATFTPAMATPPCARVTDGVPKLSVNPAGGVIVRFNDAFCVTVPPFAVTSMV